MQSYVKIQRKLVEVFAPNSEMFIQTKVTKYPFPLPLNVCEIFVFRMWFAEPTTIYVATAPDHDPFHLSSFEVFESVLQVDGFTLSTPDQALAYTNTVFTPAPPLPGLFYIVSRANDLPIWEAEKRDEIIARFESVITLPAVTSTERGL